MYSVLPYHGDEPDGSTVRHLIALVSLPELESFGISTMASIDWESGRLDLSSDGERGPSWSVVIAGDWAPLEEHAEAMIRAPMRFYGNLGPILGSANLAIVNVEGVLGSTGRPAVKDGRHMRLPESVIEGLVAVPFHLVCLANNHAMDFGMPGLARTQGLVAERGLQVVGAGPDGQEARRPFITEVAGVRLAVVNAAEGEEGRSTEGGPGVADLDRGRLSEQIVALREEADVVIAILHAGREFVPVPPPYIQQTFRALAEAGADLVVGHHPHVPQGVEVYHGRPIIYSLGNFALWIRDGSPFRRVGYLVEARFQGAELSSVQLVPYRIADDGLTMLAGDERAGFLADIARASELLPDPSKVEAFWQAYADRWLDENLRAELITIASLLLDDADLLVAWSKALSQSHGIRGRFVKRCARLVGRLARGPECAQHDRNRAQGAAILRNRFDTPAHYELYLTVLRKLTAEQRPPSPEWAQGLIERWEVFG